MMWESGLSSISTCSRSGGSRLGSGGTRGGGTHGECCGGRKADSIDSSISETVCKNNNDKSLFYNISYFIITFDKTGLITIKLYGIFAED